MGMTGEQYETKFIQTVTLWVHRALLGSIL